MGLNKKMTTKTFESLKKLELLKFEKCRKLITKISNMSDDDFESLSDKQYEKLINNQVRALAPIISPLKIFNRYRCSTRSM
jgi:hypothetical protein